MIATPGGKIAFNQITTHVPLKLGSKLIKTDLILLNLEGMDVILGMDWMTKHKVLLDISSRAIEIDSPYQGATILYLCNTQFTKGHKPSNHIHARIKSRVYTTE